MKIVHVAEPFATGVALFVQSLTESMPDDIHIVIHGERKKVMKADDVKKNFPQKNVRFIRWRFAQRAVNPIKDLFAFAELYRILTRLKREKMIDAVHLHSSKSGFLGRIACRMAGIDNVLYTPNGASFLSARNKLACFIYKFLEKLGSQIGGQVVCCSVSESDQYREIGVDAVYINNGIEMKKQPYKAAIKKSTDQFTIVTSGRIESQKKPILFNDIAHYFEDIEQIRFVWIGDGKYRRKLTAKNITVTGWLDHQEACNIVGSADIYLSTSFYEGLSFGVLEALAMQKPVLLSNCTGNSVAVKNGINGNLFTGSADAIVKILQYYANPDMLKVMGTFSEEICRKEFDVRQNFPAYRDLYAGLPLPAGHRVKWEFV